MTVVRHPKEKRRGKRKQTRLELVILILLCLTISSFVSFRMTEETVDHKELHFPGKETYAQRLHLRNVDIKVLEHEALLKQTIKSCLPESNKNCKLYIPEKSTTQRVAVMAPPGDFQVDFHRLLQVIVSKARKMQQIDIQLIPTTHVPPYGYGKTHGWTRIIRVIPKPFVLGATNALIYFGNERGSIDNITVNDIKSSLRLQMRYHCRLSHVSAHTALMSIDMDKGLLDTSLDSLIQKLQIFLGVEPVDVLEELADVFRSEPLESIFHRMELHGANLLTHAQMATTSSILEELDKVLLEEMRISKNLTTWPCESFWTVGSQDPLDLSPAVTRIAKSMSPDCLANYTSCWVNRDICEARGDGRCREKK